MTSCPACRATDLDAFQHLTICNRCGVVFNADFHPTRLDDPGSSARSEHRALQYATYTEQICRRWVEEHGLIGGHVVEIRCGAGELALALLRAGAGEVTELDASTFTAAMITPGTAAVVCRHTLEHVRALADFGAEIAAGMRKAGTTAFLCQVSDLDRLLVEGTLGERRYQQCSYFTAAALDRYLRSLGFAEIVSSRTFDNRYVVAEAELIR